MPGSGRNQPCPCGSGRKTKHCCGEQRGPSKEQLARAHVAQLCHQAIPELAGLLRPRAHHLSRRLIDLPAIDLSLLVTLPKLIGPDLERLCEAIEHDDPDWGWDALTNVHKQIDTPNSAHDSPRPSSDSGTRTGSGANKPPSRCSTFTARSTASSRPACSKPSPFTPASNEPPAASRSPPNLSVYPGQVARHAPSHPIWVTPRDVA